jgi:GNAT superfamily N-acetyltransferase
MKLRPARPEEYEPLGDLIVAAYAQVLAPDDLVGYQDELRDVAGRAAGAEVLVAVDGDRAVLGGVTYVPGPESPSAEFDRADAAGIRMLAVAADARGRGVGEALVRACIDRARTAGKGRLVLYSTDRMTTAHRIYQRLGFTRDPALDWEPVSGLWLRWFELPLAKRS